MPQLPASDIDSPLKVTRDTTATRQQVWDVIAEGWTYSQWVVGNSRMRSVDPRWPQEGSTINHSIGVWPLLIDDETVVETCDPEHEIVLLGKGRLLGAARITLRLKDIDNGCRIEMSEVPVNGPLKWMPRPLALLLAQPRNRECTWRLSVLARRLTPDELE